MENLENLAQSMASNAMELSAFIENHKNHRNEEIAALQEENALLKKSLEEKEKVIKVRESSIKVLTARSMELRHHFSIDGEAKKSQLKRSKSSEQRSEKNYNQLKVFYRQACQSFCMREENYMNDIERLNNYIHCLHSTLERHGIFNQLYSNICYDEKSDRCESEIDYDEFFEQARPESDTEFDDEESEDEDDWNNEDEHRPAAFNDSISEIETQAYEPSQVDDWNAEDEREDNSFEPIIEFHSSELEYSNEIQCVEQAQTNGEKEEEGSVQSTEDSQPIELKPEKQSGSTKLPQSDYSTDEVPHNSDNKNPQQVISAETKNDTGSDKKVEVTQKLKLDPFVHGYREVTPVKKAKKQRQRKKSKKPKSKTKFSSLMSLGSF